MRFGVTSQKILLLLLGGLALGLSYSSKQHFRVIKNIQHDWRELNRHEMHRAIRRLNNSKLVRFVRKKDGTSVVLLNRKGRAVALRYSLETIAIHAPKSWDGKWRIILFDIPEEKKRLRDVLRYRLQHLGLQELQKSVFVHPYDCRDEIDFLVELYKARRYVRYLEAVYIDNGYYLKNRFMLK